jgi:tryptophan-rich sensory protein
MAMTSMPKQIIALVAWLAITFTAAFIGAVASSKAGDFYKELVRPVWAPPAFLFAPVWTFLYLLMGISAWLVWKQYGFHNSCFTLWLYLIQLALNALWTWIFFKWHHGAFSFSEIVILWFFILATMISFWRLRPMAGALLLPYLAWVTFATFLTFSIWKRNPQLLA